MNKKAKKTLMGLGLDNKDGHTRVTQGENFYLAGGSKETHSEMQEKAVKLNEGLKKQGKTLENASPQEFMDVAHKVGLHPAKRDSENKSQKIQETKKRF
jgi:hypothetical protein